MASNKSNGSGRDPAQEAAHGTGAVTASRPDGSTWAEANGTEATGEQHTRPSNRPNSVSPRISFAQSQLPRPSSSSPQRSSPPYTRTSTSRGSRTTPRPRGYAVRSSDIVAADGRNAATQRATSCSERHSTVRGPRINMRPSATPPFSARNTNPLTHCSWPDADSTARPQSPSDPANTAALSSAGPSPCSAPVAQSRHTRTGAAGAHPAHTQRPH
jgi:hypothetical protein